MPERFWRAEHMFDAGSGFGLPPVLAVQPAFVSFRRALRGSFSQISPAFLPSSTFLPW